MSTVIAILGGVIALLLSLLGWQGTRIRQEKEKRKSAEKTAEKHTLEMERIRDAQGNRGDTERGSSGGCPCPFFCF